MLEILSEQRGALGIVTLNRPKALNSLSINMIAGLSDQLAVWASDDKIKAVLIKGAEDRAFCAGGDIKAAYNIGKAYQNGERPIADLYEFFASEYAMNKQLYHYKKPLIALMDGITMGGGFGVAGPCDYKIATDKTLFAMPETGIGLFPDVGSMYFLNQCPGSLGTYLAVSGNHMGAADTVYCGLASHYISEIDEERFIEGLEGNVDDIDGFLERSSEIAVESGLSKLKPFIDDAFSADSIEGIMKRLEKGNEAWHQEILTLLRGRSPLSMTVSLKHLQLSEGQSFDDIIARDFVLLKNFLKAPDFYEGVRAAVIDKDKNPQWKPQNLKDVTEAMVDDYFREEAEYCTGT